MTTIINQLTPLKGERINTMNNFDPNAKDEVKDQPAEIAPLPTEQANVQESASQDQAMEVQDSEEGSTEG